MLTLNDINKLTFGTDGSLIKLNDFISELVPIFHSSPYRIKKEDTVESLYKRFIKKEIGGWCGLFTQYMVLVLKSCGVFANIYNYGLKGTEFTHTIVTVNGFFLDPYFNKCYMNNKGHLIKAVDLLARIKNSDFSFSPFYGCSLKTKRVDKEGGHKFLTLAGKEWEESLLLSWKKKSLDKIMEDKFNTLNLYHLMLYKV